MHYHPTAPLAQNSHLATGANLEQLNQESAHTTSMAQVNLGAERSTSLIQMTSWSSKGASSQNPMLTQPEATTSVRQPTTCTSSNIIDTAP